MLTIPNGGGERRATGTLRNWHWECKMAQPYGKQTGHF